MCNKGTYLATPSNLPVGVTHFIPHHLHTIISVHSQERSVNPGDVPGHLREGGEGRGGEGRGGEGGGGEGRGGEGGGGEGRGGEGRGGEGRGGEGRGG